MKFLFVLFISLLLCCFNRNIRAQDQKASVHGRLNIQTNTSQTYNELSLLLPQLKTINSVDTDGYFVLRNLGYGYQLVHILYQDQIIDSFKIDVKQDSINIGIITVIFNPQKPTVSEPSEQEIPTINLEEDLSAFEEDYNSQQQNISLLLNSNGNRDPFLQAASFVFSQYYFRTRGYQQNNQQILFNGILLNDPLSGGINSTQWTGLNDWFKNPDLSYGLSAHQQSAGRLGSVQAFQFSAADQNKMSKISISNSNRNYTNRIMLTHHSGLSKKNWAYSFTCSRRWATEGFRDGAHFDAYATGLSVAKVINSRNQITINILYTQSDRGRFSAVTQELYQLTQNRFYNPNWGWQNDRKRNAGNTLRQQPLVLLQHNFQKGKKNKIQTSIAWAAGQTTQQGLDWYNAIDPRSDYYRNMPSYYQQTDPNTAASLQKQLTENPDQLQINWQRLYEANYQNFETLKLANGDSIAGRRALYALGADIDQYQRLMLANNIVHQLSEKTTLSGGLQATWQSNQYYREMKDLLGADYFLNYNMFAAQQFLSQSSLKQYDLQNPDRAIKVGDRYRYHYTLNSYKANLWVQMETNLKKWSFFTTAAINYSSYERIGWYKNGLYPKSSLGKNSTQAILGYIAKAGITYKLNGRNYFFINGLVLSEDPGANNLFIAPRMRNQLLSNIKKTNSQSAELAYIMHAPKLNIKALIYITETKNNTQISRFFNDDPAFQTFVNFVMSGFNTRQTGTEIALDYALSKTLNINAVAALGQSFFTNRPTVQVYRDNDTNASAETKEVYLSNYYLGVGPQSVYSGGFSYNAKKYWNIKMSLSYFDRNYIAVNPNRRSQEAAELIDRNSALYARIFEQEKLPSFYSLDLSAGKSWRLHKLNPKLGYKTSLYFNIGINNLLNSKNIILSGQEQLRYDFSNNNPDKFPNKYLYAMGRNFFANISLKF